MDPSFRGWTAQGAAPVGSASEQGQNKSSRPQTTYGPGGPQRSPPSVNALPPPNNQYPYQASHNMPGLPGINHPSPRQAPSSLQRVDNAQSQQGPGFSLPAISQATGQPGLSERERERAREAEQIHIKEEADRHHREMERQRMEQAPPHQAPPGPPIHLHQPVAVGTRTVHGPNGLLAQPGMSGPPQSQHAIGAPNGPGGGFPGGLIQPNGASQQNQPGLLMPFAGAQPSQPQQMPQGQGQGQQPILNDALSYLDQVKVQFSDHPDVYNRFLDIMKDFKGGVIDTPGVIGRVSQLFAGNPGLIQGFNTFLPPGYRIECGEGDDPNVIRVTTPAGTSLQSIPGTGRPLSRQDGPDGMRRTNGIYTPQPGQAPQMMMSPGGRPVVPNQQYMSAIEHARQQEQQAMHQQEQRGVSHLQNAVSNATAHAGLRPGMSPVPGRATPLGGGDVMGIDAASAQAGLEKRGPVEFNHAISYVNKIKNRFATQPDIYKQFLEILQTYQRESKPIQDVYSQVTHLFKTAPDLLDDFKQFLPETAAQVKAAAQARQQAEENVMMSNMRGEPQYASPIMSREGPMGTPNHGRGLPPVGNFAPTPNPKDNKRKRGERQGTAVDNDAFAGQNAIKGQVVGPAGKRMKQTHPPTKVIMDQPPTSPTLIPALPSPLPPTSTSAATNEELHFFDRAKKVIGNKNTFNEFLKLCNLFSQDLIDRTTLVHRARAFIGGNPDLMKWFQDFVGYDERDILIENKVRIPGGRVSLSNCRGLGPSYRLLPKRSAERESLNFPPIPSTVMPILCRNPRLALDLMQLTNENGYVNWSMIVNAVPELATIQELNEKHRADAQAIYAKNPQDPQVHAIIEKKVVRGPLANDKAQRKTLGNFIAKYQMKGRQYANLRFHMKERHKVCSGRDELCNEVLNDIWASHPTWASEDSGFIAHKKNSYEEALHRIEEERHDYDFNIETCGRTIQLLEPLAQQLTNMNDAEQRAFQIPQGLGSQSESIWRRVIYKLYGRSKGNEVIVALNDRPWAVLPVLLNRLKERKETWQLAQREWEKIWRDQTQRMFWKSLDHQHIAARSNDKRAFQVKTLQSEIMVRREEIRRLAMTKPSVMRRPQLKCDVSDKNVVIDATHLVLVYLEQHMPTDSPAVTNWFREVIPLYLRLDAEWFANELENRKAISETTGDNIEASQSRDDDQSTARGRKAGIKGKGLLRNALDPTRSSAREGSQASNSRASTPGAASVADGESTPDPLQTASMANGDDAVRWLNYPANENMSKGEEIDPDPNRPYARTAWTAWINLPQYCFMRMFLMLVDRLHKLKKAETVCRESVRIANLSTPARDLGLIDKNPSEFFDDISDNANFYTQMLRKFEGVIDNKVDFIDVEDIIRRYYLTSGSGMYAFEKMLPAIIRYANNVIANDGRDRSTELYQLFKKDSARDMTSYRQQREYRHMAERLIKDGELYRLDIDPVIGQVGFWLTKKDDPTYDSSFSLRDLEAHWRFYLASYTSLAPTEGVDPASLKRIVLPRNLRNMGIDAAASAAAGTPSGDGTTEDQVARRIHNVQAQEQLIFRIAVNSYQPLYQSGTADWWFMTPDERTGGSAGITEAADAKQRRQDFMTGIETTNNAMTGMQPSDIAAATEAFDQMMA
ncbi:hypothetical protein AMS68_001740 [Peltaster fructicola]|uniref:Histone deacetylase interacting domain-containing protein n=1 Tax=Peltaster fructicola TaxID=286661 RepID=A0A6H0XNC3_9PEZI|nr:hypothetical protein AMS68_001740 [Peltaster fructicola]